MSLIRQLLTAWVDRLRRLLARLHLPSRRKLDRTTMPAPFRATFGTWEDDRPADEIIAEIYASRGSAAVPAPPVPEESPLSQP